MDVQNRVAVAQSVLPPDVIRQGIQIRKQSTDFLSVIALTSPDQRYDSTFLSNYALLNIQDAMARIPGVGFVRLFGARDYSMRIWLDPDKMARLGVTAGDVARVVQEQNVVAPAGRIGVPPVARGTADAVFGDGAGPARRCDAIRKHRSECCAQRPDRAPEGYRAHRVGGSGLFDQRAGKRSARRIRRDFPATRRQRARRCQGRQQHHGDARASRFRPAWSIRSRTPPRRSSPNR